MIYLDTSVALAWILAESRRPPERIWQEQLVASRLLEYELFVRMISYGRTRERRTACEAVIARIAFVELDRRVLERTLSPFKAKVRTPDALHLATVEFLLARTGNVRLASYDERMCAAATAEGIRLYPLP